VHGKGDEEGRTRPAEFRVLIAAETARWKPVIEAAALVGQQ
jgi:hypothetical protein